MFVSLWTIADKVRFITLPFQHSTGRPAWCILSVWKRCKSSRVNTAIRTRHYLRRHGWQVMDHPSDSPDLSPSNFRLFGPTTKSVWLTSVLQQSPTSSKLSSTEHRHLTAISSTPANEPWCKSGTAPQISMASTQKSDLYHLPPVCHVDMEVRIQFAEAQCLITLLSETCLSVCRRF